MKREREGRCIVAPQRTSQFPRCVPTIIRVSTTGDKNIVRKEVSTYYVCAHLLFVCRYRWAFAYLPTQALGEQERRRHYRIRLPSLHAYMHETGEVADAFVSSCTMYLPIYDN